MVLDGMMQSAFRKFCGLFGLELVAVLGPAVDDALPGGTASTELDCFIHNGRHIITLLPGQVVDPGETRHILYLWLLIYSIPSDSGPYLYSTGR
jgi:hypothetical protein